MNARPSFRTSCSDPTADSRSNVIRQSPLTQPSILLVSYHFYPSNEIGARRPTALAKFLVDKGVRVVVVSAFGGKQVESGAEILPGVVAVPVRRPPRKFIDSMVALKRKLSRIRSASADCGSNPRSTEPSSGAFDSVWTRMRDRFFRMVFFIDEYKSWGRLARKAAIREGLRRPPNLVLSSSPPASVLWSGALAARRLRVPHIVDMRDPWTDIFAALHPTWTLDLALSRRIEGWVMRSAAAITSTGSNVIRLLTERQPELASKSFVVRNGFDGTYMHGTLDTGGRLAIFFAGELYLNRDPFPLLHALERLLSRPHVDASRVSVTFMGRRTEQTGQSVSNWLVGKRCAQVVKFLPPQPPEAVAKVTLESSVLLNLAQHQPLSVPAKTFEHLASGRENLLLCEDEAESATLVAGISGVIQVDPADADALDRVLMDLYERHVNQGRMRAPTEEDVRSFSRATAHETFWWIISSVGDLRAPSN
jgi:hypothetical protein